MCRRFRVIGQCAVKQDASLPSADRPIAPWIGLAVLLTCLALVVGYDMFADFQRIRHETEARLRYHSEVVRDSFARRLQSTSSALDSIREDLTPEMLQPKNRWVINHRLEGMVAAMTGVRTFVVVDRDGIVIASNREPLVGHNFKDSERYAAIRHSANKALLLISRPFVSPLNVRVVSTSKMIVDAQGKFAGYVLAILDLDYFETLMRSVLYTPDVRATLVHQTLSASLDSQNADGLMVRFAVADTGIGIEAEALTELLSDSHKFSQLDDGRSRKYGGLGVGLASVRELARLMGGQHGATSTPGQGSCFWFSACLPNHRG